MITLRPYQKNAIKAMHLRYENAINKDNSQIVMATGTGKTEVFLTFLNNIYKENPNIKCLILERQIDLVKQTYKRAVNHFPNLLIGQYYDGFFPSLNKEDMPFISISTAQTLVKYVETESLSPDLFNIIIIDECHHANADTFQLEMICNYFNYRCCIGVTATPAEKSKLFHSDNLIFSYFILDAQNDKYLIKDIHYYAAEVNEVTTMLIDYESAISKIVFQEQAKHCLWYCKNNFEINELKKQMEKYNIDFRIITAETPTEDRENYIIEFEKNPKLHLININVCNEGIDIPVIETIIIAKPINSAITLKQIIGRGLRLAENKNSLTIYDLCGQGNNYQKLYQEITVEPFSVVLETTRAQRLLKLSKKKKEELLAFLSAASQELLLQLKRLEIFSFKEIFCYPELSNYRFIYEDNNAYLSGVFGNNAKFYFMMEHTKGEFHCQHNCFGVDGYRNKIKCSSIKEVKELLLKCEKQNSISFIKYDNKGIKTEPTTAQIIKYCMEYGIDEPDDEWIEALKKIYSKNTISFAIDEKSTPKKVKDYFERNRI